MTEVITKVIFSVMLIMLTNIIIPRSIYDKQIKLLSALIFAGMILGVISDISNNYANDLSVFSRANAQAISAGNTSYNTCMEYVLNDYKENLKKDMQGRIRSELGFDIQVTLTVNEDLNSEDFGEITGVSVFGCDENDFSRVEKTINSFYNVDYGNIYLE